MSNRVIHFEIQADDIERAKKFYEGALGWKIEKYMGKHQMDADAKPWELFDRLIEAYDAAKVAPGG